MPWTDPISGATVPYPWEDGAAGGTPLDALDLNTMQQYIMAALVEGLNSLAAYVDTSIATALGTVSTLTNTGVPVISGTPTAGTTLQVETVSTWSTGPAGAPTVTRQWQSAPASTGPWTNVSGATSLTEVLASALVGDYVSVLETATYADLPSGELNPAPVRSNVIGPILSASLTAVNNAAVPMAGGAVLIASSPTMNTTTADDCGFIILQRTETALAQQAKAANPNCKVLMYCDFSEAQNASAILADVDSGVTYSQASNEGWLLEDSGSPILLNGYSGQYATDIGNTAYQQACISNIIGLLGTPGSPWDGVFCDDINTSISDLTGTAYASGSTYATAMGQWCEAVCPAIADAGFIVIGNFGDWWLNEATMNAWLASFDGAMMEMFMGFGQNPYTPNGYATTMLSCAEYAAAQNKYFLGVCQAESTDIASQTYCTAALLLASPGSSFMLAYSDGGSYDVAAWPACYASAIALGRATGAATSSGEVYTREFENGSVSCNFSSYTGSIAA